MLRTLKVRDVERPAPLYLIRRRVDLDETDARGEPVTSCVIDRDHRSREDREAERVAAVDHACRETDAKVLRAMRDYSAATSISKLRSYVGLGMSTVSDTVARLLRAGWVLEGPRGKPYTVTETGRARLDEV